MNISRKDFFKKSLMSLGEAVFTVKDALKTPADVPKKEPDLVHSDAMPRDDQTAAAYNDTCLARSSGCFSCVERCEQEAIKLIPGVGIRINQRLCNGCGICEYVCPVTPKAVRMEARNIVHSLSAIHAENQPQKGE